MFSYNRFNFFPCLEGYISIVNFIVTVKNICIITMKINRYLYSQPNYLTRTAIEAVLVQQTDSLSLEAGEVPILVCFYILCNNKSYKKASEFLMTRCLHRPFKQQF